MTKKKHDVLTYKQYSQMGYAELFRTVQSLLRQSQRLSVWFGAAERLNLLPALQALHDKVAQPGGRSDLKELDPSLPNWSQVCLALGISPAQVRMWRMRTQSETDIRHLLGEEMKKPNHRADPNAQAVKHLRRLALAVLDGKETEAEHLAAAVVEIYKF